MIDNPDKKNKPRHAGKTLGEVALAIGLVPVFLAALAGVGHFFVAPLFNEVIEPILNAVFAWFGHIARERG
ncbi:MAG TPA: hypothetical protein VHR27_02855, partial [Blastocatellia bacterium]|nr:hypothetical protein [Blastocatellia bacterium]